MTIVPEQPVIIACIIAEQTLKKDSPFFAKIQRSGLPFLLIHFFDKFSQI